MKSITAFSSNAKNRNVKEELVYVFENHDGLLFSFSSEVEENVDPTKKIIGEIKVYNSEAFSNFRQVDEYTMLLAKKSWESDLAEYISHI